jgi:polysaccharide export outer membrane protein
MRTVLGYRSVAAAMLMALGIGMISSAAQTDHTPPAELVQYIRETKRHGFADAKIKSQAVAVGWPAATVDEALAYVRNEKPAQPAAPVAKAAAPAEAAPAAPAPTQLQTVSPEVTPPKPMPATPEPAKSRGAPDDYVIGSGDTLQISVWKEPEASVPAAVVRPDGKITVPMVKDVEVAGLTPAQAEERISAKLKEFIADASVTNVTVVVAKIDSKKIYVTGAARKEGPIPYTGGLTVLQALSEAGGLTDYAKRKKIYILRPDNGQNYRLDFNYDAVLKGENMEQNILLLPGDTIVIPH